MPRHSRALERLRTRRSPRVALEKRFDRGSIPFGSHENARARRGSKTWRALRRSQTGCSVRKTTCVAVINRLSRADLRTQINVSGIRYVFSLRPCLVLKDAICELLGSGDAKWAQIAEISRRNLKSCGFLTGKLCASRTRPGSSVRIEHLRRSMEVGGSNPSRAAVRLSGLGERVHGGGPQVVVEYVGDAQRGLLPAGAPRGGAPTSSDD